MESRILEIVLFSEGNNKREMIQGWIAESVMPIIAKQEKDTQKFTLETLAGTPAVYMS